MPLGADRLVARLRYVTRTTRGLLQHPGFEGTRVTPRRLANLWRARWESAWCARGSRSSASRSTARARNPTSATAWAATSRRCCATAAWCWTRSGSSARRPGDELVVPRLSAQRGGRGARACDGAGARDDVRRREGLGGRRRVGPGGTLLLLRRAQAVPLRLPLVLRGGEQRRRGRAVLRQLLPRGRHGPHRRDAGRGGCDDLPRRSALPPGAQPVPRARGGRSSRAIDLLRLPADRHLGALAAAPGRRRHPETFRPGYGVNDIFNYFWNRRPERADRTPPGAGPPRDRSRAA